MDFNDFLTRGLVEYVDVNEENNSLIALYEADITPQVRVGHILCPTCLLMGITQWACTACSFEMWPFAVTTCCVACTADDASGD